MKLVLLRATCDTGRTCPNLNLSDRGTIVVQGYVVAEDVLADLDLNVPPGARVVEFPLSLIPELRAGAPDLPVHLTDRDSVLVWGPEVTDSEALAELAPPSGEAVIELPQEALPLPGVMWDEQRLGEYIDAYFTCELFRLETLPHYQVASDGGDLARYLAGEPGPDMARKGPWMDVIRGEVARGLHTYRVHVVRGPLSDYLRFEFEWGYTQNEQAGERIRILDLAESPRPDGLLDEDYWLISGRPDHGEPDRVARMHYDSMGRYLGAELVADADVASYRRAREVAWSAAVPFRDYWQAHPQYWRPHRAA